MTVEFVRAIISFVTLKLWSRAELDVVTYRSEADHLRSDDAVLRYLTTPCVMQTPSIGGVINHEIDVKVV